jgi:hypothetical protein
VTSGPPARPTPKRGRNLTRALLGRHHPEAGSGWAHDGFCPAEGRWALHARRDLCPLFASLPAKISLLYLLYVKRPSTAYSTMDRSLDEIVAERQVGKPVPCSRTRLIQCAKRANNRPPRRAPTAPRRGNYNSYPRDGVKKVPRHLRMMMVNAY